MAELRAACAALALVAAPALAAQTPSARLGAFDVIFGETRLSQLREAVGAGLVDRHAGLLWLCYTAAGEGGAQRIWITSRGAEADAVTAERLGKDEGPSPACPALPPRFRPLSVGGGVWLGMTLAEIERALGAKARRAGLYFEFSWRDGSAAPARRIVVEIVEGQVVRLWANASAS